MGAYWSLGKAGPDEPSKLTTDEILNVIHSHPEHCSCEFCETFFIRTSGN